MAAVDEKRDACHIRHSRAHLAREESRKREGGLLWCIVSVGGGRRAWENGEDAGFLARGSHVRGNDRMGRGGHAVTAGLRKELQVFPACRAAVSPTLRLFCFITSGAITVSVISTREWITDGEALLINALY